MKKYFTTMNRTVVMLTGLVLTFVFTTSVAYAALTLSSSAITSDGNLNLSVPSGLINIGPDESTLNATLQGWTGSQRMLITSLNQNAVAGIEAEANNGLVVFNPVGLVHGAYESFINEAQGILEGNGGTANVLAGSISVLANSAADTGNVLLIEPSSFGSSATIQNLRGIDIKPQTAGIVTSYNILSEGSTSQNRFEGSLTVGPDESTLPASVQGWTGAGKLFVTDTTGSGITIESYKATGSTFATYSAGFGNNVYGIAADAMTTINGGTPTGIQTSAYADGAGVTAPNSYGIYVNSTNASGGAAITNNYGIFINDQSAATNNYAIKTGAGLVSLGDKLILRTSQTPASSSATCTTGTIAWDASYTYVCVATNTWKRSALATW